MMICKRVGCQDALVPVFSLVILSRITVCSMVLCLFCVLMFKCKLLFFCYKATSGLTVANSGCDTVFLFCFSFCIDYLLRAIAVVELRLRLWYGD
jgi:hypothetical protein